MGRLVEHTIHIIMTSAVVFLVLSISFYSADGFGRFRPGKGGLRPGVGGFRPGVGGFRPGMGGLRPGIGGFGGQSNMFEQDLDALFREAGIVPDQIANAPESSMQVFWDSGLSLFRQNQAVDTGDIMNAPQVMFPGNDDKRFLNTIMIVDFGADIMHWMVMNVPGGDISSGDENIEYLPPFSYKANEDETAIEDTGDNGVDQTAVLVFRQAGPVTPEENLKGCNQPAIFGRRVQASSLISKYNLFGPKAGMLFWTKYSEATEELLCYSTKCTGIPFPFPIPGVNDKPECRQ